MRKMVRKKGFRRQFKAIKFKLHADLLMFYTFHPALKLSKFEIQNNY